MPARQNGDERALDHVFLTEDHSPDAFLDACDVRERPFGLRDDLFGIGGFRRNDNAHVDLAI
ncbi:hypothetical protein D3C80_2237390 [compost metagenome]